MRFRFATSREGTPRHGATTLSHERRHNELRFSMMEFFKSACTRKRSLARSLGKYDGSLNSCRVGSKVYSVSLSPKAICIGDIIPSTHPHFVHSLSPSSTPVATTLSFVYPQSGSRRLFLSTTPRPPLAHPRFTSERLEISGIGLVVVHPSKTWTILNLN